MELHQSFYGRTTREALAAVRETLGDDAVIIRTNERRDDPARRFEVEAVSGESDAPGREPARATVQLPRATTKAPGMPSSSSSPLLPPRGAGPVDHRLLENLDRAGLDATVRARLVDRARRIQLTGVEGATGLQMALSELVAGTTAPWITAPGYRRFLAFVGPTGGGKTTTIAKVAAQALLLRRRVALITTDTWRVGATQHLARYGEIMGLPTYVAENEHELVRAVDHARDCDLVLIDTAGRSPRSLREGVRLRAVRELEVHLVVPATASASQLGSWRARHRADEPAAIIATKLDEAEPFQDIGGLLNAAAILGLPVAGVADGQTVPDDISPFDGAALWRRLGSAR